MKQITFSSLCDILETRLSQAIPTTLAIDGPSASGKSSLASMLSNRYAAAVIHMDDFFLRPEQRTEQRYAQPGGNVDRERFLDEVAPYLKDRKPFSYARFDCSSMRLGETVHIPCTTLTIVEGSYSLHPDLAHLYDIKLFLEISPEIQKARIETRNGSDGWRRFSERWIPLEQNYFSHFSIRDTADLVLKNETAML